MKATNLSICLFILPNKNDSLDRTVLNRYLPAYFTYNKYLLHSSKYHNLEDNANCKCEHYHKLNKAHVSLCTRALVDTESSVYKSENETKHSDFTLLEHNYLCDSKLPGCSQRSNFYCSLFPRATKTNK